MNGLTLIQQGEKSYVVMNEKNLILQLRKEDCIVTVHFTTLLNFIEHLYVFLSNNRFQCKLSCLVNYGEINEGSFFV